MNPWYLAEIKIAAPQSELGLLPYSSQSTRILFKSRFAVISTSIYFSPNSKALQNRRINTLGSINGKSLCKKRTNFRKHAPKVYRFILKIIEYCELYMQCISKVNQKVRFISFSTHNVQTGSSDMSRMSSYLFQIYLLWNFYVKHTCKLIMQDRHQKLEYSCFMLFDELTFRLFAKFTQISS